MTLPRISTAHVVLPIALIPSCILHLFLPLKLPGIIGSVKLYGPNDSALCSADWTCTLLFQPSMSSNRKMKTYPKYGIYYLQNLTSLLDWDFLFCGRESKGQRFGFYFGGAVLACPWSLDPQHWSDRAKSLQDLFLTFQTTYVLLSPLTSSHLLLLLSDQHDSIDVMNTYMMFCRVSRWSRSL